MCLEDKTDTLADLKEGLRRRPVELPSQYSQRAVFQGPQSSCESQHGSFARSRWSGQDDDLARLHDVGNFVEDLPAQVPRAVEVVHFVEADDWFHDRANRALTEDVGGIGCLQLSQSKQSRQATHARRQHV